MNTSKIIKGVVNSGRYTVTAPIVKEDYGIYLQIEGVELPNYYLIYNSNGDIIGEWVLNGFMDKEPEGIYIDRKTKDIYISLQNKFVYKIEA